MLRLVVLISLLIVVPASGCRSLHRDAATKATPSPEQPTSSSTTPRWVKYSDWNDEYLVLAAAAVIALTTAGVALCVAILAATGAHDLP
jgi:hypothetical protein